MHRGAIAAAVVGLCSPLLFGCDGDTAKADPTTTPTTASVSLPSPVTTPPPTTPTTPTTTGGPTIPPLARLKTMAGAKAYIHVFVREMNTAWTTMETSALRSLFGARCTSCASIAAGIDGIRNHGGSTQGAIWSVRALSPIPLQPPSKPIVHAAIDTSRGRWKPSAEAAWRPIPSSISQWDFHLSWTPSGWVIDEAVSQ